MLCLTRNAGYSVSQPQTPSQLGFILTSLFLLTPYEVDCVASAKQIFSVFLFLVLYLLSYKIILPSALFCSSPSGDCLLHEVLNKGCLYDLNHLPLCCCFSVAKSGPTLGNPMNCSAPGFSDLYYLPQFAQTHVHWVGDAIQPSHRLSSPSPPAFNLSQDQGLFKWVSSFHLMAKVLEFQLQHQSFQWTFRTDFL